MGESDRKAFRADEELDCGSLQEVCALEQRALLCAHPNMTLR